MSFSGQVPARSEGALRSDTERGEQYRSHCPAQHPGNELERGLLLAAGAWAVYRQAGQEAEYLPTVRAPAAPETLRTCSPQVAKLLESMFAGEHEELLPEALERMRQASLRLPPSLLPAAYAPEIGRAHV